MSIHSAVAGSLKKLTDKGEGGITQHNIEHLDDGTFIHEVVREKKSKHKEEYPMHEREKHTHSSVGKLASCLRECHSGVVED